MSTVVALKTDHRTERDARIDLAACYRLIAHFGMDDLIYTHISVRVPNEAGHFLINPYGMMFHEITASSLVKIDYDGNVVARRARRQLRGVRDSQRDPRRASRRELRAAHAYARRRRRLLPEGGSALPQPVLRRLLQPGRLSRLRGRRDEPRRAAASGARPRRQARTHPAQPRAPDRRPDRARGIPAHVLPRAVLPRADRPDGVRRQHQRALGRGLGAHGEAVGVVREPGRAHLDRAPPLARFQRPELPAIDEPYPPGTFSTSTVTVISPARSKRSVSAKLSPSLSGRFRPTSAR